MEEPLWKKIQLSLERPYKDDNGDHIPVLLDITPDGQHIYETKENSSQALGDKLRRIFVERGVDFFERNASTFATGNLVEDNQISGGDSLDSPQGDGVATTKMMTTEELYKMRVEILPQLFISLGEMSHARDLMASLLLSSQPLLQTHPILSQPQTQANLSATVVSKPPPIISVQTFNTQLTVGSKDEALRKAAVVFKSAAESMERGRIKGEKYWVDALKVRRGNWGLIPAPLPYGSATGKGADRTSKDFLISYGLEESPSSFRRKAIARMPAYDDISESLVFPYRQHTRLCVSVTIKDAAGERSTSHNTLRANDANTLDGALRASQQEIVEQEIFSLLVQEAGSLPTASARVAERLIVIDAAQGLELKFELLDTETDSNYSEDDTPYNQSCDLIYSSLHGLLLRRHWYSKIRRLGNTEIAPSSGSTSQPPPILQPIIDLLQYQVFCQRIKLEIDKMVRALSAAGIPAILRFNPVGETSKQLMQFFDENSNNRIGGEAVLRIDNGHMIRLTFLSPSSLTAHLPQATLTISSIPQLCQLLTDETERCLLQRICELGIELCECVGGTWFVDLSRCVGRWEGCVINFRISYGKGLAIHCSAFRLDRTTSQQGQLDTYSTKHTVPIPLLSWVEQIIKKAL